MTYTNPVLRVGLDEFAARAADSGVSAMIVADLPVDEAAPFVEAAGRQGMGTVLFVAPTTTDSRLRAVVDAGPVFVYGIAEMGVTGERARSSGAAEEMAMRVRAATQIPLVFGVGIASPESAARAAKVADGVIVGSALVRRVLEAPDLRSAGSALAEIGEGLASAMAGGS
jgi:tryptophan synthase alpha chain